MVASFGSALVHGSPWDSRFLLYTTDNARSCNSTYDTLDSWIAWAFAELAAGQWLGHSPWGEVMGQRKSKEGALIADGWRGVLFAHRGDEKALAKCSVRFARKTMICGQVHTTCFLVLDG